VARRLHNVTHLSIIFQGTDGDALDRLADDLALRLRRLPAEIVDSVEYRTDAQEAFLRRFGGLYLSVHDIDLIQERIDRRITWEKRRRIQETMDILGEGVDAGPPPPLDFGDIEKKYGEVSGALSQFRKYFSRTASSGDARRPPGRRPVSRPTSASRRVKREVEALQPTRFDPTVRVGYDGEVATLVEEQAALVSDLASSTVVTVVLVFAVMWIYFRRWTALLSIFGALSVGVAVTFGLSWFLIGYLNANTAFLGSIVVGNGINVSIIFAARFLEERRRGVAMQQAIGTAWSGTLAATFVASFGAGLAYLSLAVTDFRGFSQFGLIGGLGMSLCWLTAYLVLPSFLAVLDRRSNRPPGVARHSLVGTFVSWINTRYGLAVRIGSVLAVLAAMGGVLTYRGHLIEYELENLRATKSAKSGAAYWGKRVDEVFRAYSPPSSSPPGLRTGSRRARLDQAQPLARDPRREGRCARCHPPRISARSSRG
jgi:hypothetical protein